MLIVGQPLAINHLGILKTVGVVLNLCIVVNPIILDYVYLITQRNVETYLSRPLYIACLNRVVHVVACFVTDNNCKISSTYLVLSHTA